MTSKFTGKPRFWSPNFPGPNFPLHRFGILLQGKVSFRCKVTLLSAFTWLRAKWNSLWCIFHYGQFDGSEISNCSEWRLERCRVFIVISWFMSTCICLFVFIYLSNFIYWKSRKGFNSSYEYLAWIRYVNFTWAIKKLNWSKANKKRCPPWNKVAQNH